MEGVFKRGIYIPWAVLPVAGSIMLALFMVAAALGQQSARFAPCDTPMFQQLQRIVDPENLFPFFLGCRMNVPLKGEAVLWASAGSGDCLAFWVVQVAMREKSPPGGPIVLWDSQEADREGRYRDLLCTQQGCPRGEVTVFPDGTIAVREYAAKSVHGRIELCSVRNDPERCPSRV